MHPAKFCLRWEPWLVILSDGSQNALCLLAYVRWQVSETEFQCLFMLAKSRIAHLNSTCISRMELNGGLLDA